MPENTQIYYHNFTKSPAFSFPKLPPNFPNFFITFFSPNSVIRKSITTPEIRIWRNKISRSYYSNFLTELTRFQLVKGICEVVSANGKSLRYQSFYFFGNFVDFVDWLDLDQGLNWRWWNLGCVSVVWGWENWYFRFWAIRAAAKNLWKLDITTSKIS